MKYKNTTINYEVSGNGKKYILFLHGWGGSTDSFLGVIKRFEDNYTCINVDFPSFGKSEEPQTPWTVQDYALMILKLLRELNVDKVNIVCHSFGCRVAIYIAALTSIVDKLVITSGAGIKPRKSIRQRINILKYKFAKIKVKLRLQPSSVLQNYGSKDYRKLTPVMRQTFKNIVNFDQTTMLKHIKCATLLIWGKNDTQTPLYMARIMNKNIKDCALIVYNGGHFVYLEQFNNFCVVVNKFFN